MNLERDVSSDSSVGDVAPRFDDMANSISSPVLEVPSPCGSFNVLLLAEVGHCLCDGA